jgi:hypothetical protein
METLYTYLLLGWQHIVSLDAIDHQLFLLALFWPFSHREIRRVLILVTAFTIGHSITLALSSSGVVRIPAASIEFLIAVSIFSTAVVQSQSKIDSKGFPALFGMTGIFGLLHGLGFANTLKSMLGREDSLLLPLFGFNAGVELGQLAVLLFLFSLRWLLDKYLPNGQQVIARVVFLITILGSAWMIWERMPFEQ